MAFMSIDDAEFWNNCPKELEHIPADSRKAGGKIAYFLMGEQSSNPPTVLALRLAPGQVLARHSHNCHRFEIIVQGSLDVGGGRILKVGDIMTSEPNVAYGPHTAGPEGSTSFEIFSNHEASYNLFPEFENGPVHFDVSTPEGLQKYRAAIRRFNESKVPA
jgi:hypothetical protein